MRKRALGSRQAFWRQNEGAKDLTIPMLRQNPAALKRILASGVTARPFSDDLLAAALQASEQQLEDEAAKDAAYRKVYDHWRAFRDESFEWFGLAEKAYATFRFGR